MFFDIDQPILEHGAEVYSYVGDGLIASWPLAEGVRDARCLRCLEAIVATLAARAGHYRRAFGVMPEVRIVLHAGPVVAGECGDAKLSIVYLGDTLNTAARIEETAKTLGHDVLISDDLLARLDLPPSFEPTRSARSRCAAARSRSCSTRSDPRRPWSTPPPNENVRRSSSEQRRPATRCVCASAASGAAVR